ncbi:hypothetical protein D3C81_1204250 [compost metagenome]
MPARYVEPVDHHGVVARKDVAVVLQHAQVKFADLGVGGIDVGGVDLPLGHCLVGNAMVDADRPLRQAIALRQHRPAIGPAQELVRQAKPQPGLAGEVGQLAQVPRAGVGDGDRIGILEAQRDARAKAHRRQRGVDLGQRGAGRQLQDLAGQRAGVVGIEVDAARLERLEDDGGVAQAGQVARRAIRGGGGGLGQDFTEDVRLGEALGAHAQRLGLGRAGPQQGRHERHPRHEQREYGGKTLGRGRQAGAPRGDVPTS